MPQAPHISFKSWTNRHLGPDDANHESEVRQQGTQVWWQVVRHNGMLYLKQKGSDPHPEWGLWLHASGLCEGHGHILRTTWGKLGDLLP